MAPLAPAFRIQGSPLLTPQPEASRPGGRAHVAMATGVYFALGTRLAQQRPPTRASKPGRGKVGGPGGRLGVRRGGHTDTCIGTEICGQQTWGRDRDVGSEAEAGMCRPGTQGPDRETDGRGAEGRGCWRPENTQRRAGERRSRGTETDAEMRAGDASRHPQRDPDPGRIPSERPPRGGRTRRPRDRGLRAGPQGRGVGRCGVL